MGGRRGGDMNEWKHEQRNIYKCITDVMLKTNDDNNNDTFSNNNNKLISVCKCVLMCLLAYIVCLIPGGR